jgi:hypothetical protein
LIERQESGVQRTMTSTLTDAIVEAACDVFLVKGEEALRESDVELVRETAQRVATSCHEEWTAEDCCYFLGVAAERLWRAEMELERRRRFYVRVKELLPTRDQ